MFKIILPIALAYVMVAWAFVFLSLIAAAKGGKAVLRGISHGLRTRKSGGKDDPGLAAAGQWVDLDP